MTEKTLTSMQQMVVQRAAETSALSAALGSLIQFLEVQHPGTSEVFVNRFEFLKKKMVLSENNIDPEMAGVSDLYNKTYIHTLDVIGKYANFPKLTEPTSE